MAVSVTLFGWKLIIAQEIIQWMMTPTYSRNPPLLCPARVKPFNHKNLRIMIFQVRDLDSPRDALEHKIK